MLPRIDLGDSTDPLAPFGIAGALTYDDDARRMPRRYERAHAIQNEIITSTLRRRRTAVNQVVVDLGAGTANDGVAILSRSIQAFYLGIERSQAMIARAEDKMRMHGFVGRSAFLKRNFQTTSVRDVAAALRGARVNGIITVAMSALALHHYRLEDKRAVYALAHDLLSPASIFVLTDLFSSSIQVCAHHALRREISDVRAAAKRYWREQANPQTPTTLSVTHYRHSNRPQDLCSEMGLLRETGFNKIDVVYRHGQLAIIAAQRAR